MKIGHPGVSIIIASIANKSTGDTQIKEKADTAMSKARLEARSYSGKTRVVDGATWLTVSTDSTSSPIKADHLVIFYSIHCKICADLLTTRSYLDDKQLISE